MVTMSALLQTLSLALLVRPPCTNCMRLKDLTFRVMHQMANILPNIEGGIRNQSSRQSLIQIIFPSSPIPSHQIKELSSPRHSSSHGTTHPLRHSQMLFFSVCGL